MEVKFTDTQSFRTNVGFYTEFSISTTAGVPGIFEAKVTATTGTSYSYEKEYSHGKELSYTFPVAPGKACTPSKVAYRQPCTGILWEVQDNRSLWSCPGLRDLDFNKTHKFFSGQDADWFHYVSVRPSDTVLYTMHSLSGFIPRSCDELTWQVEARTLNVIITDPTSKASLEFDNGSSVSAVSCLY
ncbi:hypothetical protein BGX28_005460 [Mortierella sp. GBA30]|nr:hypothetical protein BGX28_005460 [Mortierella sp. GBA30]